MNDDSAPRIVVRAAAADAPPHRRLRLPIALVLMLGFGSLVFVAVAAVLGIGLWSARQNTVALLSDKAGLSIDIVVANLRHHLDPVAEGNADLAAMIGRGEADPRDPIQLADYMRGAIAATPQVIGMAFIDTSYQILRVSRSNPRVGVRLSDWSDDPQTRRTLAEARAEGGPYWGELVWSAELGDTLLNRRAPLWREGRFIGVLVSLVTVGKLSASFGAENGDDRLTRFVLQGDEYVLAHFAMRDGRVSRSTARPLPQLAELGDPVLSRIWTSQGRPDGAVTLELTGATQGHRADLDGVPYLFLYRQLGGYGQDPLWVGAYARLDRGGLAREVDRLLAAAVVGSIVLLLSVAAALVLGRRLGRPIGDLAVSAERIRDLDFAGAPQLRPSRLLEVDRAAMAFNAMVAGLRWFETYVPRAVVRRLLAGGASVAVQSEERPVTVMFTDIRGFTALAQSMSGAETAALLNQHFSLVAACVDAEEGTVDKYIGDSMMAFWGAPQADPDHVGRACRAALAIRRGIALDNERRVARGEAPLSIGIGIHTGIAIVGNIGAPGRINYTLVGDTVNVAQRLEELSKEIAHDPDGAIVEILVSSDVAGRLGTAYALKPHGAHPVRGRRGTIDVFRLQ